MIDRQTSGEDMDASGVLIYGGSFNPVHIGHLRLAIEARELLADRVRYVDFVPAAIHPQKEPGGLLPFDMRCRMLEASLRPLPRFRCNNLEGKRSGPSYTIDTLKYYLEEYGTRQLYFLLGSQDYTLLSTWRNGLELPRFCNMVIVPRGSFSIEDCDKTTARYWPRSAYAEEPASGTGNDGKAFWLTPFGTEICYLPVPHLDISASRIRHLWLNEHDIRFLVPHEALEMLEKNKKSVRSHWQEIETTCSA